MPPGVDLYERYNTVTNWERLSGLISFAWLKVSDGDKRSIVTADGYVNNCLNNGIPWGPYHFAMPGHPVIQAEALLAEMVRLDWQPDDKHLIPALDLEQATIPMNQRIGLARVFLETVHAKTGGRVALYATTSWLAFLKPETWGYDWLVVWAAEWGPNDGTRHPIVHYDGRVTAHQYTSKGRLSGVTGFVDLDWTDDINALLATGDTMTAQEVWDFPLAHQARPGDTDVRATVSAAEQLEFANKAAWMAADGVARLEVKLDAVAGTLSSNEAELLAAVRGVVVGTVDIHGLATALAPLLPADATPDQVADAVAHKFALRLDTV